MKISNYIVQEAMEKACQSKLKFKVSAIAFDTHGDYLDRARNSHRNGMTGKGQRITCGNGAYEEVWGKDKDNHHL